MTKLKRSFSTVALVLGVVGLVGCLAMIVGLWIINGQLKHTMADLYGTIDDAFVFADEGLQQSGKRLDSLATAAKDLEQRSTLLAASGEKVRLLDRQQVQAIAERLSSGIDRIQHGLQFTTLAAQIVENTLESGSLLAGAFTDEQAAALLEAVTTINQQVSQGIEEAETLRKRVDGMADGNLPADRLRQVAEFAKRFTDTLGMIKTAHDNLGREFSTLRAEATHLRTKLTGWLHFGSIAVTALLFWMAVGQGALVWTGARSLRAKES